jgi:hypothetical protein
MKFIQYVKEEIAWQNKVDEWAVYYGGLPMNRYSRNLFAVSLIVNLIRVGVAAYQRYF